VPCKQQKSPITEPRHSALLMAAARGSGGGEGGGAQVKGQGLVSAQEEAKRGLKILDASRRPDGGAAGATQQVPPRSPAGCEKSPNKEPCWLRKSPTGSKGALTTSPAAAASSPTGGERALRKNPIASYCEPKCSLLSVIDPRAP